MKLYAVTDEYIRYLRKFDNKVYDNKENNRKVMRKYLGIVLTINELNYYIPMSSPKNMIPVPISELILYEPKNEQDKDYKIYVIKQNRN